MAATTGSPDTSLLLLLEEKDEPEERPSCLCYPSSETKQKFLWSSESEEHLSHGGTFSQSSTADIGVPSFQRDS